MTNTIGTNPCSSETFITTENAIENDYNPVNPCLVTTGAKSKATHMVLAPNWISKHFKIFSRDGASSLTA